MAFPCFNWPTPTNSLAFHWLRLNRQTVPISRCGVWRAGPLAIIAAAATTSRRPPSSMSSAIPRRCHRPRRRPGHHGRAVGAVPDARPEQRRDDRRTFAPVADSDYMAFAEALVRRDRNRHARAGRGDCFFFDPFAAAVEPAIMTGQCTPPWRSPWHQASLAAQRSSIRRNGSGRPSSHSSRKLDSNALYAVSVTYVPRGRR